LAQGTVGSYLESDFFDVEERPTSGLSTTPSPYGFPGRQSGTWVRVINPPPCCTLVRSLVVIIRQGGLNQGAYLVIRRSRLHPRVRPVNRYRVPYLRAGSGTALRAGSGARSCVQAAQR
jgi:hypothetical protein